MEAGNLDELPPDIYEEEIQEGIVDEWSTLAVQGKSPSYR